MRSVALVGFTIEAMTDLPTAQPPTRPPAQLPAPVTTRERHLAPDLARGVMLLAIVLANTPLYLYAAQFTGFAFHPDPTSVWDAITQTVLLVAVDQRVYPMYSFLVGYGLVMLDRRQTLRGTPPRRIRGVITRRSLAMIAIGFVHALLLFDGDIVGVYGFLGLLAALAFSRRRDRTIGVWAWVFIGLTVLASIVAIVGTLVFRDFVDPSAGAEAADPAAASSLWSSTIGNEHYPATLVPRVAFWAIQIPALLIVPTIPAAILAGMWASRKQLLERPAENRVTLTRLAAVGIPLGWATGALAALRQLGVIDQDATLGLVIDPLSMLAGLACGIGYAAVFGLLAARLTGGTGTIADRHAGFAVTLCSAVGQRSLSCYLAQSVLCAPVLAAWGLGLGAHLTSATMALYAIAVWFVIALGALALHRRGMQGPGEWLVRRLAYPRGR